MEAYVDFHLLVEAIVHDETVGHAYPVRLHGMARNVGVVSASKVSTAILQLGWRGCLAVPDIGCAGAQKRRGSAMEPRYKSSVLVVVRFQGRTEPRTTEEEQDEDEDGDDAMKLLTIVKLMKC